MAQPMPSFEDPLIGDLVQYIQGPKFQGEFEKFFLTHSSQFEMEQEQKLEYTEIYQDFQELFEEHIAAFIEEQGVDETDFLRRCREANSNDPNAKEYLKIVFASMEYDAFVQLMLIMKPYAEAKAEATQEKKRTFKQMDSVDEDEISGAEPTAEAKDGEADDDDDVAYTSKAMKGCKV